MNGDWSLREWRLATKRGYFQVSVLCKKNKSNDDVWKL